MTSFQRRGLSVFGLALVVTPLALFLTTTWAGTGGSEPPPPAVVTRLGGDLSRAGLSATALTAAGASSAEIATVVSDANDAIEASPTTVQQYDAAYQAARRSYDALRRKVRSGLASAQEVTECQNCKTSLQQAESNRDSMLDTIFEAGTQSLTAAQQTALANIRANRIWELATEYLVVNRSQPEWVALGDALAVKRIAEKESQSVPPLSAALLAKEDADPAIAAARTNISTYLAPVQTAWNTAVDE